MDSEAIIKSLQSRFAPGDVFEVRAFEVSRKGWIRPHIEVGYFQYERIPEVAKAISELKGYTGIYTTLNPVKPQLLARAENKLVAGINSTGDKDIVRRRWLFVDIDPVREKGISATDPEKLLAHERAQQLKDYLFTIGFTQPVEIDSGNGAYLLYRIDQPAEDNELTKHCLTALQKFSDDKVEIDQAVYNAARLIRVPGTINRKGDDFKGHDGITARPHRMAKIISITDNLEIVPTDILHRFAETAPVLKTKDCTNISNPLAEEFNSRIDFKSFIESHGWKYLKTVGNNQHYQRPGKSDETTSATYDGSVFYVFSSNAAQFKPLTGYSPFKAYAMLEHNGDYSSAFRKLEAEGYGKRNDVCLDGINSQIPKPEIITPPTEIIVPDNEIYGRRVPLSEMAKSKPPPIRPVIEGLLGRGDKLLVCGKAKSRKSWFVFQLALFISEGLPFLGINTIRTPMLYCNLEIQDNWMHRRYQRMSNELGATFTNGEVLNLRGRKFDKSYVTAIVKEKGYGLIVLDPVYKLMDGDENNSEKVREVCALFDYLAKHTDAAIVFIHHDIKGNVADKDLVDRGAGSNIISRDFDGAFFLSPHQDYTDDSPLLVVETVARNFKPIPARTAEINGTIFVERQDLLPDKATTRNLRALENDKNEKPTMDDFIEKCIAPYDPVNQRCITVFAQDKFDISKRGVEDMLNSAVKSRFIDKARIDNKIQFFLNRPGYSGQKTQAIVALLINNPELESKEIARQVGASVRQVNKIKLTMPIENSEKD